MINGRTGYLFVARGNPDTAAEGFRPWCVRDCANRYGRCCQLGSLLTTEGAGEGGPHCPTCFAGTPIHVRHCAYSYEGRAAVQRTDPWMIIRIATVRGPANRRPRASVRARPRVPPGCPRARASTRGPCSPASASGRRQPPSASSHRPSPGSLRRTPGPWLVS